MNIIEMEKQVLQDLYQQYIEDGGCLTYSIKELIAPYNINLHEFGSYLVGRALVVNQTFLPTDFQCGISISGIEKIDTNYFKGHYSNLMSALGTGENEWIGLHDFLELPPVHGCRIRDIASVLENSGRFDVEFTDDVYVQLSAIGLAEYNIHKPNWG